VLRQVAFGLLRATSGTSRSRTIPGETIGGFGRDYRLFPVSAGCTNLKVQGTGMTGRLIFRERP